MSMSASVLFRNFVPSYPERSAARRTDVSGCDCSFFPNRRSTTGFPSQLARSRAGKIKNEKILMKQLRLSRHPQASHKRWPFVCTCLRRLSRFDESPARVEILSGPCLDRFPSRLRVVNVHPPSPIPCERPRGETPSLLSCSSAIAETAFLVVIDHPYRLHEGVADGRPHELESAKLHVLAHGVRFDRVRR